MKRFPTKRVIDVRDWSSPTLIAPRAVAITVVFLMTTCLNGLLCAQTSPLRGSNPVTHTPKNLRPQPAPKKPQANALKNHLQTTPTHTKPQTLPTLDLPPQSPLAKSPPAKLPPAKTFQPRPKTRSRSVPAFQASVVKRTTSTPRSVKNIVLRSRSNDEAFTEPIESIKVACGESGIVGDILVKLGDEVTQDQLLVELDKSVLQAMLSVAQSKANTNARLKANQVELETKTIRYQKLVELKRDGAGSTEEVIKAKADMEVAQQNVAAIKEETEQFRLEMQQIEAQIEQRRIRSPIDGVVVEKKRKVGEYISINDPHVVTVVQLDTLRTVFHLPTTRAIKINQGDTVDIVFTESNQVAQGVVEYVSPITRAASGRVRVEVLIDNRERTLRSGVRCQILHDSERTSMMSPNYK